MQVVAVDLESWKPVWAPLPGFDGPKDGKEKKKSR
jgi:hypothetical protein